MDVHTFDGQHFQTELWEPEEIALSAWVDPELWQHVRYLLQDEKWDQVASQTAICWAWARSSLTLRGGWQMLTADGASRAGGG